jgi:hypothetical protein
MDFLVLLHANLMRPKRAAQAFSPTECAGGDVKLAQEQPCAE